MSEQLDSFVPDCTIDDVIQIIITNGFDGVCLQNLKAMDHRFGKWSYLLSNNRYKEIGEKSSWFNDNYVKSNYGSVVFATRECNCGSRKCKVFFVKERHWDPVLDGGIEPKNKMITNDPRILKLFQTDQKFINKQFKKEFKNKENLDYQLINSTVARLEADDPYEYLYEEDV